MTEDKEFFTASLYGNCICILHCINELYGRLYDIDGGDAWKGDK